MNDNGKQAPERKVIVLEPNKTPAVIGAWSVGEVRQMAQLLIAWLDSIPLSTVPEPDAQAQPEQA